MSLISQVSNQLFYNRHEERAILRAAEARAIGSQKTYNEFTLEYYNLTRRTVTISESAFNELVAILNQAFVTGKMIPSTVTYQ